MTNYSAAFTRATHRSQKHYERTANIIPAGATRSLNSWAPYPVYLAEAQGNQVTDIDGNTYTDFLGNYTALVHGHQHPLTMTHMHEQLTCGLSLNFATVREADLAQRIVDRLASVEMLRFTGSGTEAVMFATRLARLTNGRRLIAKMEGGFHGTHDTVSVSVRPPAAQAGDVHAPHGVPESEALSAALTGETIILPFNHERACAAILDQRHQDIAGIIVEPMLGVGGMIPPRPGFLEMLREKCDAYGIVLIFDEVITLRLGYGGGQAYFGVQPDLTTMGKIIGGGMPIGAVGGKRAIMHLLEPQGGADVYSAKTGGPKLYQGGTFTGHPLSMAAGIGTLDGLTADHIQGINRLGDDLRAELNREAQAAGLPMRVTGSGSLLHIHLSRVPIETYRDTWQVDNQKQQRFFLGMLERQHLIAQRGMVCLSTTMNPSDLTSFLDATLETARALA
ncbi:aminotransferase class III-fold pyridoxal phosphate-dependent enzyme [Deinococcus sp. HMF7620]|uniref:Aminotransferase class III-fold pyridoxal phosphate-dependent enzyme n=1 Tax=Deinococcus arboris TaxID=2682977 RepID=A0A7C9MTS6_9DEIO|nr:aspartate aminotransferase family protein [Deinococcus arboris]MVN89224.1 aminotransferase class III-fold pyridoxal phosphate-dependent enzyme [Deinococcus arboris]